jgi:hypothetical protein
MLYTFYKLPVTYNCAKKKVGSIKKQKMSDIHMWTLSLKNMGHSMLTNEITHPLEQTTTLW